VICAGAVTVEVHDGSIVEVDIDDEFGGDTFVTVTNAAGEEREFVAHGEAAMYWTGGAA